MLLSIFELDMFKGGSPDEIENKIIFKFVGKHQTPKFPINPEELKKGISVEKEHTDDKIISQNIAQDHLAEMPDYYKRLDKMEKEGEKAVKKAGLEDIYKEG